MLYILSTKWLSPAYKMVWPQTRLQNGFLQPTQWYGHKLDPTKWCSLSTILDLCIQKRFLNSTSDYKIRCTTSYRYQIRCMPSDYKIGCTTSYRYHIQCMPSDYKIGCTTSYRYHIQCMPSDYKIGLHHFNLFLPFSLNSPPNQEL